MENALPVAPATAEAAVPSPAEPAAGSCAGRMADAPAAAYVPAVVELGTGRRPGCRSRSAAAAAGAGRAGNLDEGLSLVDADAAAVMTDGAVLVLAGIGGPDAVRKLLAALPPDFPRPVLVQLRLDGGRYDNLVKQVAPAFAVAGRTRRVRRGPAPGDAYVLPDGMGLASGAQGLHFEEGAAGDVVDALPPGDSAVLMLSGSDPARWAGAVALAASGAWVAGQSLEG